MVLLRLLGGSSFGIVGAAASVRLGLPTRANKVGFDLGNSAATGAAHVTFDLLELGVPVRAHLNGGYTFQAGKLADDNLAKNPFFLDGADGALVAMASQQWFFDQVHMGIGVEVPLPYVTPFVEVWYQTALGAEDYAFFGDAWLTCQLTAPATVARAVQQDRTGRWCVGVATAVQAAG